MTGTRTQAADHAADHADGSAGLAPSERPAIPTARPARPAAEDFDAGSAEFMSRFGLGGGRRAVRG